MAAKGKAVERSLKVERDEEDENKMTGLFVLAALLKKESQPTTKVVLKAGKAKKWPRECFHLDWYADPFKASVKRIIRAKLALP